MATITARHKLRDEIRTYLAPTYFPGKTDALWQIDAILKANGFQLDENHVINFQGDEGSLIIAIVTKPHGEVLCDCCDKPVTVNNRVAYQWYKMQSGSYEINAYIS